MRRAAATPPFKPHSQTRKTCGYSERFAQAALGRNSKAVRRAYSKRALMKLPSLEAYKQPAAAQPVKTAKAV